MRKLLKAFIQVERSIQTVILVGGVLLVGSLAVMNHRNAPTSVTPLASPILQP